MATVKVIAAEWLLPGVREYCRWMSYGDTDARIDSEDIVIFNQYGHELGRIEKDFMENCPRHQLAHDVLVKVKELAQPLIWRKFVLPGDAIRHEIINRRFKQ